MAARIVIYISLGLILMLVLNFGVVLTLVSLLTVYITTGGWRFLRVMWLVGPRDVRTGIFTIIILLRLKRYIRQNKTVPKFFDENVQMYPNKPFLLFQDSCWTFSEAQKYTNQVANFLYESGYRKGDVIALYAENCMEYIPIWLGMARIGVVAALINFNLKDVSLSHCIKAGDAKAVIVAGNLVEAVKEIRSSLPQTMKYFILSGKGSLDFPAVSFDQGVDKSSSHEPPAVDAKCSDRLLYMYTSGTTGLPKAAIITHIRFMGAGIGFAKFFKLTPDDVDYIPLPLYHAAGGHLGASLGITVGATLAIRTKFSARYFWVDCIKYKATVSQYIGETCRYLLAQPVCPEETRHQVRIMIGNGIKPLIWKQFQHRFNLKQIGEFYASTEGISNSINFENRIGAVGFLTQIFPSPKVLVKVDPESYEIIRDKNGICQKCEPGEPGQLVGKVRKGVPAGEFDGYVDVRANSKKIIRDVFKKGDMAFASGDILVMDELGYLYFRDRIGDTYRWHGENVSTTEVEAVISSAIGLDDAVVYGVEIPGCEGRAGMAAIVDRSDSVDVGELGMSLARSLPVYARPMFLRFIKEADITGTFKLKKTKLRDEGFDISNIKDRIYFLNPSTRQYVLLTPDTHRSIVECKLRL